ncbi:putative amino acid efflux transmembrane protein [Xenorhabdus bovienii str. Jollieti]|uniref:Putative amino acid efflux transmembrane protein n=1 Tax=Xenorhabdus bovienii (strain SS-2004) TaxID=406818 RepID=D3UWI6_XENBS|nr:LysE family translocator [Xenorhabdus bovienii]CBJ79760.1 putative amino acid efflux transmembrane protein [Xenorhabdus bovienii SS-2004]CDH28988.1 putative amino acid efflux transmembrane protein [Xenorhabdus bovienii str. Jollieti]
MLSNYWGEFLGLAMIHFLAVVAPGPDFAVTIQQSVKFGRLAGVCTAIGIGAGISVHVVYTLVGISSLMHSTPWLMEMAKLVGSLYIIWLGIKFIKSKPVNPDTLESKNIIQTSQSKWQAFLMGFMTNALNPKATLFFLAVFTTVVSINTPILIQVFYGLWMCIANTVWFVLVSVIFSNVLIRNKFMEKGYWFERVMGIVLISFAIRLLFISV